MTTLYETRQNRTALVLADMMTEYTGRHFLDSGFAYGRNFERNAGMTTDDFLNAPRGSVRFETWGRDGDMNTMADVTVSLFHWLHDRVLYAPHLQRHFDSFVATRPDSYHEDDMMEYIARYFPGAMQTEQGGIPQIFNSYNQENLLSQVIQFVQWFNEDSGRTYVLLQIHGGYDIRGGYTRPRVFEVQDPWGGDHDYILFDQGMVSLYSDDSGRVRENQADYWDCDLRDSNRFIMNAGTNTCLFDFPTTNDPALRGLNHLYIDDDGRGYCPYTGGQLRVG